MSLAWAAALAADDFVSELFDQLYSDPLSSKLVPFQAWMLANVPPVIRF
jgi:hypothetical protein